VTDNWEDSKIVAVIERLGEFGRKTNERTFQQPCACPNVRIV
jgi:hypothetical protein